MNYQDVYPGQIHFEKKGHIAFLKFDNPKNLNALSKRMFDSINEIFDAMIQDRDILGVVLTGEGRAFIVGADLSEESPGAGGAKKDYFFPEAYRDKRLYIHQTMLKIANFPRPTLAAINGYALGGGMELALNCDIRVASTTAKMGFPEGKIGGFPAYTGPTRAVRLLGLATAKEMIFTARHYTAEECLRRGLVCEIYEPDQLMAKATEMMEMIVSRSPICVRMAKEVLDRSAEMSLESSLEYERYMSAISQMHPDAVEGGKAFFEKRDPVWNIDGV